MKIRKNLIHEPSEGLTCMTPSKTQQQFRDECDVNNILNNYVKTGILTHTTNLTPQFGDFSQVPNDYGEALAVIKQSEEQFAALPSAVREKFDNNPLTLIQFLKDENNREEAEKLGLINKPSLEDIKDSPDVSGN